MSENNRSYRLRTKIGVTEDSPVVDKYLTVKLDEDIDTIDIMSLKIKQENTYKFHAADYGVVVGRAIANGGFGVPNVKVSVFIAASEATKNDAIYNAIYPYERVTQKNSDNIRYNLLPDAVEAFHPVHAGHHVIHKDYVIMLFGRHLNRFFAVLGLFDPNL